MTKEERLASPRAQALVDIVPIVQLVNFLKGQSAVSSEAHKHFERRYRILNSTIIGAVQNAPDGIGEIGIHRKVNDDGSIEG